MCRPSWSTSGGQCSGATAMVAAVVVAPAVVWAAGEVFFLVMEAQSAKEVQERQLNW